MFTIPVTGLKSGWTEVKDPPDWLAARRLTPKGIMQKIIGIVCVLIGLWFLWCAYNVDHSVGSAFSKTFTGSALGGVTHNVVAGIIVGGLGAFLLIWKGKKV